MTFNVLNDGIGGNERRPRWIAQLIRKHDPDILCVQEGGDAEFWSEIARQRGYGLAFGISGADQPAVFSRLSVIAHSSRRGVRSAYVKVPLGRGTLGVYSVHLPHPPGDEDGREAALAELFKDVRREADTWVGIAGDFNSRTPGEDGTSWGLAYFSRRNGCEIGKRDWVRATELMAGEGFVDCFRRKQSGAGFTRHPAVEKLQRTLPDLWEKLPADVRFSPDSGFAPAAVRIDYIFANPALAECLRECALDDSEPAFRASDHLPVWASFRL